MSKRAVELIRFLKGRGNHSTTREIQRNFRGTTVAYKMTQGMSEARELLRPRETITCFRANPPSLSRYVIQRKRA